MSDCDLTSTTASPSRSIRTSPFPSGVSHIGVTCDAFVARQGSTAPSRRKASGFGACSFCTGQIVLMTHLESVRLVPSW